MPNAHRAKTLATLALTATLGAAFVACGDGGDDQAQTPPTTTSSSTSTSTSTESSTTADTETMPSDAPVGVGADSDDVSEAVAGCLSDYDFTAVESVPLEGQETSLVTARSPEGVGVDVIPVESASEANALSRQNPLNRPVALVSDDRLSAVFFARKPNDAIIDSVTACVDRRELLGPSVSANRLVACLDARGFTGFNEVETDSAGVGIRAFLPGGRDEIALFDFDDRDDAERALDGLDEEYDGKLPATLIPGGRFILSGEGVNQAIRGGDVRACLDP